MKGYFEDLYNIDTQEQVRVHRCGFHGIQRGHYFKEELIRRTEVDVRVRKIKNGKDEVSGKMVKGGDDMG